jgi:hypothetical protein
MKEVYMSQDKYSSTSNKVVFNTTSSPKLDIKNPPAEADYIQVIEKELPTFKNQQDPWIHRSDNMRCKTCMWFVEKQRENPSYPACPIVGRCRRHAPTMSGYPVVFNNDWCGDHRVDENKI